MNWIDRELKDAARKKISQDILEERFRAERDKRYQLYKEKVYPHKDKIEKIISEANLDLASLGGGFVFSLDFDDNHNRIYSARFKNRHSYIECNENGSVSLVFVMGSTAIWLDNIILSNINKSHMINIMGIISSKLRIKYTCFRNTGGGGYPDHHIYYTFLHFPGLISSWRYLGNYIRYLFYAIFDPSSVYNGET